MAGMDHDHSAPNPLHRDLDALQAGLADVRLAPRGRGTVEMLVARPAPRARTVLEVGQLDPVEGLVGDNWRARGSSRMPDNAPNAEAQLTVMNARAAALVAGERERWPLAGDQVYVDLDIGAEALPAGTRLRLGEAVIEVTALPHRGCAAFAARFGHPALRFVNSDEGLALRLRGVNARIVEGGTVRVGDAVVVVETPLGA